MAAIDLRLLNQFVAVAEEGGFGRAAARLHMAQPPLSAAIRRLETELGGRLFDRTSKGARLTPAGQVFLTEARAVLARAARATDAGRSAAAGRAGTLRLAFVGSATFEVLPGMLTAFRAANPDVELVLTEATTAQQVRMLLDDDVDAGIGCPPLHDDGGLASVMLRRTPFVAALPDTHRLATAADIRLADLAGEPFVLFPRTLGPGLYDTVIAACRAAGFTPRVAQEAVQLQTIAALVAGGLGVALLPASARAVARTGAAYVDLVDPPPGLVFEHALLYRHADPSPILARLRRITSGSSFSARTSEYTDAATCGGSGIT
ncbi:LysR family transcriptional regulator [Amycolatopsis suaedae]|uniref:LysR family transcriptional regulator n=1 Tax=Amycolatopsis suaedae TaxID=2510978 RepID=A0A4Q7IYI1_9PSEU|nr:LysR family transcriptional regulator [Amycolatopsis suaedae]RZQ59497.1 LysR family transcriptional regulator [Amycolatopsis suaedae]